MKKHITKDQLLSLRAELETLTKKCNGLLEHLTENNVTINCSLDGFGEIADYASLAELESVRSRKREIEDLLRMAEIIPEIDSEEIQIGSTFEVDFEGEEKETFILVETLSALDSLKHYVSIDSPLGKSVIGKKQGDKFSYSVGKITIGGFISKVFTREELKTSRQFIKK